MPSQHVQNNYFRSLPNNSTFLVLVLVDKLRAVDNMVQVSSQRTRNKKKSRSAAIIGPEFETKVIV